MRQLPWHMGVVRIEVGRRRPRLECWPIGFHTRGDALNLSEFVRERTRKITGPRLRRDEDLRLPLTRLIVVTSYVLGRVHQRDLDANCRAIRADL